MTFNQEFLRELNEKISKSGSYPMTKKQIQSLTKIQLCEIDKKIIFSCLINDISNHVDEKFVSIFWNEKIKDEKLKFKF